MLGRLAELIDTSLQMLYGRRVGFALMVFPFKEQEQAGIATGVDYISNANREDIIEMMRNAADRLEVNDEIGVPVGSA